MLNKMVKFEPGELEIAIVTYNRCMFIAEWLKQCYRMAQDRNISISIYDSSINDETEKYIYDFKNRMNDKDLKYYHIPSNINIGYKPMIPILNSKAKYIWVSGDSRYHEFQDLDKKVFPYLKKDIDYVVLHICNNEENDEKIYTDRHEFFKDCFISMTCIGLSIYKTSLFGAMKSSKQLQCSCDQKYKNNYAFAWIGYFLEMFCMGSHKALFSIIPIKNIKSDIKIHSWFQRCYECWVQDLCDLMDSISEKYQHTESVMRNTWIYLALDSPGFCIYARKKGDLNKKSIKKYMANDKLFRVTKQIKRIVTLACAEEKDLDRCLAQCVKLEIKEFEDNCYKNINKISECSKGKKIWIYGAGKGGNILMDCLIQNGISIYGFLDQTADGIKRINGFCVKKLTDINYDNVYVVISLFYWQPLIIKTLLEQGLDRNSILYLNVESNISE